MTRGSYVMNEHWMLFHLARSSSTRAASSPRDCAAFRSAYARVFSLARERHMQTRPLSVSMPNKPTTTRARGCHIATLTPALRACAPRARGEGILTE